MSPVWLVARREIIARVRTRAFVLGTAAIIALLGGYAALMVVIGQNGGNTTVGFTGQATAVAAPLQSASTSLGAPITVQDIGDPADGERRVRDGELDALVTGAPDALNVVVKSEPSTRLRAALDTVMRQQALDAELAKIGVNPSEVRSAAVGAQAHVTSLERADPQREERLGLAMASGILLYMFLIMSGQAVAQGVVEEKSSRVVELLLSTIRPTRLLTGKVLGIGLAGLLQFVIIAAAGLTATTATGLLTLPSAAVLGSIIWALVWFVLGFFCYATVLAAAASLVSRQEELQGVVTPVIMILVVPFVIGISILPNNPESTLGAVLSLVPGFSPVLMPMRIALNVAAPWEVAASLVLTLATVVGLLWLGGRIYSNAVLRNGARVKLSDALRAS
jgi:ABC-2 type transport system permease protein